MAEILKGVEIPPVNRGNGMANVARRMDIGDCAVVATSIEQKSLISSIIDHGFSAVTRKQADGTFRVWKVARKPRVATAEEY